MGIIDRIIKNARASGALFIITQPVEGLKKSELVNGKWIPCTEERATDSGGFGNGVITNTMKNYTTSSSCNDSNSNSNKQPRLFHQPEDSSSIIDQQGKATTTTASTTATTTNIMITADSHDSPITITNTNTNTLIKIVQHDQGGGGRQEKLPTIPVVIDLTTTYDDDETQAPRSTDDSSVANNDEENYAEQPSAKKMRKTTNAEDIVDRDLVPFRTKEPAAPVESNLSRLLQQYQQQRYLQRTRTEEVEEGEGGGGITNLLDLDPKLLIRSLGYVDPKSLGVFNTLNKNCHAIVGTIIHDHPVGSLPTRPLLYMTASKERNNNNGRSARLLRQLYSRSLFLQPFFDAILIDFDKFDDFMDWDELRKLIHFDFVLVTIESLTISSNSHPTTRTTTDTGSRVWRYSLLSGLAAIMPNVQRINLTGVNLGRDTLWCGLGRWRLLTKITWCGIGPFDDVYISGRNMEGLKNLREIYMDDSCFSMDLSPVPDRVIFHRCSKKLERLSIRNATYYTNRDSTQLLPVSQEKLIQFVRNAPSSLTWFRSDLTVDNITMLQQECPGIEFVAWPIVRAKDHEISKPKTEAIGLPSEIENKENLLAEEKRHARARC